MNEHPASRALVVYESFFGNTEEVARAVARGLELGGLSASVVDAASADHSHLERYDVLVVGAPTHAFALSRPATRQSAAEQGGSTRYKSRGMREWLSCLPFPERRRLAAAFDTRAHAVRHLPVSAAASAGHLLKQRGYRLLDRPRGFVVQALEGPLEPHETERAVEWGRSLAHATQVHIQADWAATRSTGS